jgi:hypothetical protein
VSEIRLEDDGFEEVDELARRRACKPDGTELDVKLGA